MELLLVLNGYKIYEKRGDKMKNRCKYCGAKAKEVCTHCQEKMAIIKRIKSMLE